MTAHRTSLIELRWLATTGHISRLRQIKTALSLIISQHLYKKFCKGADEAWAFGWGAGGNQILWNRKNGIVYAGMKVKSLRSMAAKIEAHIKGPNPLEPAVSVLSVATNPPASTKILWRKNGSNVQYMMGKFIGLPSRVRVYAADGRLTFDRNTATHAIRLDMEALCSGVGFVHVTDAFGYQYVQRIAP